MSISSYTDCIHYTNLLLFSPTHLTSVIFLYHIPFFPLNYICFPVFSSPRNSWADYLFTWTTVIIQSVLFLGEQHLIHISCWGPAAQPGWGSPVPLLSATDPQWFHLCLLCLAVHRLLLPLWNGAWIMLARLKANKTQHLDDHCFTATNHRIKEWFR